MTVSAMLDTLDIFSPLVAPIVAKNRCLARLHGYSRGRQVRIMGFRTLLGHTTVQGFRVQNGEVHILTDGGCSAKPTWRQCNEVVC